MLEASQFVPVVFEATVVGFDLSKSLGRLAARLLATHGEAIDDEMGIQIPRRSATFKTLELVFRDRGLLTVTPAWVSFEGSFPEDVGPGSGPASETVKWAVDLLMSIMTIQKANVMALSFELTWLLQEQSSTAPLAAHFGLSHTLGGFFKASENFEIRGDTTTELPDLFPVKCEVVAGQVVDFEYPENVGVQIKHRSPDNRFESEAPVHFTSTTVDQFFAASPQLMERQLVQFFPIRGAT
ncbi:MAG: hypothetical protein ACRCZF_05410 [Gemmataceae bacterium]